MFFKVSYLGLVENVRVRRAGFAYRQRYDRFLKRLIPVLLKLYNNNVLKFHEINKLYFRYKMISEYTWPNFRNGNDKDGTRVLLEQKGFGKDVKYGHTKIFIRYLITLDKNIIIV